MTTQEYLQNVDAAGQAQYARIRTLVQKVTPDFEEVMSYGVATFKHKGKYLIYFGAYADHLSVYPIPESVEAQLPKEVAKFKSGKGTLRFTAENPLPDELILGIIKARFAEINKLS